MNRRSLLKSFLSLPIMALVPAKLVAALPAPGGPSIEERGANHQWLLNHLTHRFTYAAWEAFEESRLLPISPYNKQQFATEGKVPIYVAFELDKDTVRKSENELYQEYIWPASKAFGRALAAVGVNIKTEQLVAVPGNRFNHSSRYQGLHVRGQMAYDWIKQKHIIIFDTIAEKV